MRAPCPPPPCRCSLSHSFIYFQSWCNVKQMVREKVDKSSGRHNVPSSAAPGGPDTARSSTSGENKWKPSLAITHDLITTNCDWSWNTNGKISTAIDVWFLKIFSILVVMLCYGQYFWWTIFIIMLFLLVSDSSHRAHFRPDHGWIFLQKL